LKLLSIQTYIFSLFIIACGFYVLEHFIGVATTTEQTRDELEKYQYQR